MCVYSKQMQQYLSPPPLLPNKLCEHACVCQGVPTSGIYSLREKWYLRCNHGYCRHGATVSLSGRPVSCPRMRPGHLIVLNVRLFSAITIHKRKHTFTVFSCRPHSHLVPSDHQPLINLYWLVCNWALLLPLPLTPRATPPVTSSFGAISSPMTEASDSDVPSQCSLFYNAQCILFLVCYLVPFSFLDKKKPNASKHWFKTCWSTCSYTNFVTWFSVTIWGICHFHSVTRSVQAHAWADGICRSHLPLLCSAATGKTLCLKTLKQL